MWTFRRSELNHGPCKTSVAVTARPQRDKPQEARAHTAELFILPGTGSLVRAGRRGILKVSRRGDVRLLLYRNRAGGCSLQ
jgi:hypothetical protein